MKTSVFSKAKDPSPRRRVLGWEKNTPIFSPIIGPFPKDINTILIIDFRVT